MADRVKLWDNYNVVGEVRKSNGKKLIVAAATLNGFRYVLIHEYYRRVTNNEWMRSAKVISIPIKSTKDDGEHWLFPLRDILPLLATAGEVAENMELSNDANAIWRELNK